MFAKIQTIFIVAFLSCAIAAQTVVSGRITRLYPGGNRIYFHLAGDGFTGQFGNYLYIDSTNANSAPFNETYQLLLKHAGTPTVIRARKYTPVTSGNFLVSYIYVDY